jgi:hypothetical protein
LRKSVVFILLICLMVAGCWQTRNRPYRNDMSLQPFAAGTVTAVSHDGKMVHYALRRIARGRYRLTLTDRGQDFGQGFELGFFPLPGAPAHVLVLQMAMLNFHSGDDSLRYYGLLVVTGKDSAQEIDPDCGRDARKAHVPSAYRKITDMCSFPDRAALEKSLLALWKSGKKPDTSLSLVPAIGSPR